jgi:3-hydroxybutyryl-CoA dehydrogenase
MSSLPTLSTVVVVGAGTMGRGIAIASLAAGLDVVLVDVSEQALEAARGRIADYFVRHPQEGQGQGHGELSLSSELGDVLSSANVVIEAVPEIADLKEEIFGQLKAAPADALLVSNTSTMSISSLAEACGCSPQVIGMHFFNPAHRMPLVEVVVGARTSERARDRAVALARHLGKDPVVVRDVPGFVTSRLGLLLGTEAMRMVEEGVATAADVDKAMRLGYGHPMGPLQLADLVGLDARLNNLRSMQSRSGDDRYRPPQILQTLVQRCHLGKKSGRGFFVYDDQGRPVQEGIS